MLLSRASTIQQLRFETLKGVVFDFAGNNVMIYDRSNSTHRITSITIDFVTFRDSGVYMCLTIQRTENIRKDRYVQAEIRVTVLQCEWEVVWGGGGGRVVEV